MADGGHLENRNICIAPYGRNFRGAVARECARESEKRERVSLREKECLSLDLKTVLG